MLFKYTCFIDIQWTSFPNLLRATLDQVISFYSDIWVEVMCLLHIEALNSVFVSFCSVCLASQVSACWRSSRKLQRRSRDSGTPRWKQPRFFSSLTANVCCNMIVKCFFILLHWYIWSIVSECRFVSGDDDIELNREIFNSIS